MLEENSITKNNCERVTQTALKNYLHSLVSVFVCVRCVSVCLKKSPIKDCVRSFELFAKLPLHPFCLVDHYPSLDGQSDNSTPNYYPCVLSVHNTQP